ncbi:MAG: hypothetical protein IPJ88_10805 [Myxococcales bacterium]|nr:MAG: hypothetical protein IPJ88_10805 [Myxococcales bacterium]
MMDTSRLKALEGHLERWGAFFIMGLGMVLYALSWSYPTVSLDDPWLIENNRSLQNLDFGLSLRLFSDLTVPFRLQLGSEYLPIRDLSIAADFALFGQHYGGFHFTNTLLYGVLCALVFLLLARLFEKRKFAWFGSLVFLTHPVHVEAVAWLSERKGLLCAVFMLCAALLFLKHLRSPRWWTLTLAALCCILSVWSKAIGITTPALLAVLVWLELPSAALFKKRNAFAWIILCLSSTAAFVPVWWVGQMVGMVQEHPSWLQKLSTLALLHGHYLSRLALLGPYGIRYPLDPNHPDAVMLIAGFCFMAALAAVMLCKRCPPLLRAAAWLWCIFFAPVSHLLTPLQNLAQDRYMLLPSLAWVIALCSIAPFLQRTRLGSLLAVALVLIQCLLSLLQLPAWKSSEALYRQALIVDPKNGTAMIAVANELEKRGAIDQAWTWLDKAEQLPQSKSRAYLHKALIARSKGDLAMALKLMHQAAQDKNNDKAQANYALMLLGAGEKEKARHWAKQAIRTRPLIEHNQRSLGIVALENRNFAVAKQAFKTALRLNPQNPINHKNLQLLHNSSHTSP